MAREWWESGFFSPLMAEAIFDARRLAAARPEVQQILAFSRLKRGARVLDAACGVGRHSLEFARRGFAVTGVDATQGYLRAAQRAGRRQKLKGLHFERGELRDLYRFQGSFDLVINLFTSFGYYRSERDNREALAQMVAALRPGGRLVMELQPRESVEQNFRERDWHPFSRGYLLERRSWLQGGRRIQNEWVIATHGGLIELGWDIRLYSVDELKAMFRRAGLKKIACWRDFKGQAWKAGHPLVITGVR